MMPKFNVQHIPIWWVLSIGFSARVVVFPSSSFAGSSISASFVFAAADGMVNDEANALLQWKSSFDNQSQTLLSSWTGNSPCNWKGIRCDPIGSISLIDLKNLGLNGPLPTLNLSSLHNLIDFHISNNSFYGTIPHQIGNMSRLSSFLISNNNLAGDIPSEIVQLPRLYEMNLAYNFFSGTIPQEIGKLRNLSVLNLAGCNLTGSIPIEIGLLQKLERLNLSQNTFERNIPSEIGRLQSLQNLDLSWNLLIGEIPTTLGELRHLETLNLSHNNLSGNIPSSFDDMSSLTTVDISYNQLWGPIPNNQAFRNTTIEAFRNNKGLCGNVSSLVACPTSPSRNGVHAKNEWLLALYIALGILILVLAVGFSYKLYRRARGSGN